MRGSRRKSFLRCWENNSVRILPGKVFCEDHSGGIFLQAWMCPRFAPKSKEKRKVLEERSCYNAEWTGITVRKDKGSRIKEMKKRIRILTLALAFSLMTSQAAQAALISPLSSNPPTRRPAARRETPPDFRGTSRLPWKGRDITAGHLPSREPPGSRTASRRQEREPKSEQEPGRRPG